jgi:hypothetical protein
MKIKSISLALVVTALMLTLSGWLIAQSTVRESEESGSQLEGSWNVVVGPGSPTEFRTLVTFAEGGAMMATEPAFPPPFRVSTVHGTWEKTGRRQFASTFLCLIYDPTGQFAGTLKVRGTATLNRAGNEYNGISSIEIFDPAGNPLPQFSSCNTTHGTRINVEPVIPCP